MIRAKYRNWHKRNQQNASNPEVELYCCGQGKSDRGGAYFQIRVRDDRGRWMSLTFEPHQAAAFAREVEHCTARFKRW